jgi:Cft2 family RNA processing exonuclease
MRLQFLGATDTVTGSKYLLQHGGANLLVDCGLFQGYKPLRLRNWSALPVAPAAIDAVILTHAHIDHSGYLPLLAREGFRGKVFSAVPPQPTCAASCCPIRGICRKRRQTSPTVIASPSTPSHCRCTHAMMRSDA